MPNLKALRNIVERLRNMSHNLIVSANKAGRLTFQIKTNVVNVSCHFTDLSIQSFAGNFINLNSFLRKTNEKSRRDELLVTCYLENFVNLLLLNKGHYIFSWSVTYK